MGVSGAAAGGAEVVLGRSGDLGRGGEAPPELTRCATAERTRFSMLLPCPALGLAPPPAWPRPSQALPLGLGVGGAYPCWSFEAIGSPPGWGGVGQNFP